MAEREDDVVDEMEAGQVSNSENNIQTLKLRDPRHLTVRLNYRMAELCILSELKRVLF